MQKTINKKVYDTDAAEQLGCKYVGEFGQSDGYEEKLFVTGDKQHFIYGFGGSESAYSEPEIKLISNDEAEEWLKVNKEA